MKAFRRYTKDRNFTWQNSRDENTFIRYSINVIAISRWPVAWFSAFWRKNGIASWKRSSSGYPFVIIISAVTHTAKFVKWARKIFLRTLKCTSECSFEAVWKKNRAYFKQFQYYCLLIHILSAHTDRSHSKCARLQKDAHMIWRLVHQLRAKT